MGSFPVGSTCPRLSERPRDRSGRIGRSCDTLHPSKKVHVGAERHVTVTPWTRGEGPVANGPRLNCRTDTIAAQTSRLGNGGECTSRSSRMRTNLVTRVVAHRIAFSGGVSVPVKLSHFYSKSEVPVGQFGTQNAFIRDGRLSRRSESSSWFRK